MDRKATVKDTENFWTCKEYVFEAVIVLLTAAAFCNDNSHSMVQKKKKRRSKNLDTEHKQRFDIWNGVDAASEGFFSARCWSPND